MKKHILLAICLILLISGSERGSQSKKTEEVVIDNTEVIKTEEEEKKLIQAKEDGRLEKLESYLHKELLYCSWHDNGDYFIQKHGEPISNEVKTIETFYLIGGKVIKYRELKYKEQKAFFAIFESGEECIYFREIYEDTANVKSTWFGMSSKELITTLGPEDQRDPSTRYWYWVDEIIIQFLFYEDKLVEIDISYITT